MYNCRQINESKEEKRQNLLIDYKNDGYIPVFSLKISNYLLNLSKEP